MSKKRIQLLGFLVLAIVVLVVNSPFVCASNEVSITYNRSQSYADTATGDAHMIYTIRNNTDRPVTNIWVRLTYFDKNGLIVSTSDRKATSTYGEAIIIDPYESYTFDHTIVSGIAKKIHSVSAEVISFEYVSEIFSLG